MSHLLFTSLSHIPQNLPSCPLELRLDLFAHIDFTQIQSCIRMHPHPILLTLRKASHQGGFTGSEEQRINLIYKLLSLSPSFFDLEYDIEEDILLHLLNNYPSTKFIISYHNFEKMPDLEDLYIRMKKFPAPFYKIAAFCQNSCEALSMLIFSRKHPDVSVICLGERVCFARVLSKVCGNPINYAAFQEPLAPGQITLQELKETYHYDKLSSQTALYGLIGDPITKSQGAVYHNRLFSEQNTDAVYVKIPVKPQELDCFIPLAQEIGFQGLSVTMPLKEAIIPFIDFFDKKSLSIQASNTLFFSQKTIHSTNTDGLGAVAALEEIMNLQGKTLVLLGAGGSCKAIAFAAKEKGAKLIILNRTLTKAKKLALCLNASFGTLADIPSHYDALINTTGHPLPIDPKLLLPNTLVMDISYPEKTLLLQHAEALSCPILTGFPLFLHQALAQNTFWTSNKNPNTLTINEIKNKTNYLR